VFPNPEEKGALDESIRFANKNNCSLIIANDPDADRLAVAQKIEETGKWKVFTGNEIGVLLGYWQIQIGKNDNHLLVSYDRLFLLFYLSFLFSAFFLCAGEKIVAIQDITKGYDSSTADHRSSLPMTPESHMIMYEFANGKSID
jgi:hypothetical protein